MVIAAGFGFQATPWVGFILASLGLVVAVYALRFHRTADIEHTQPVRII